VIGRSGKRASSARKQVELHQRDDTSRNPRKKKGKNIEITEPKPQAIAGEMAKTVQGQKNEFSTQEKGKPRRLKEIAKHGKYETKEQKHRGSLTRKK